MIHNLAQFCLHVVSDGDYFFSCRRSPAAVRARRHRGAAALHAAPPAGVPQEAAAPHEDGVPHQPERGHAAPPSGHRHPDAGEERTGDMFTNTRVQFFC